MTARERYFDFIDREVKDEAALNKFLMDGLGMQLSKKKLKELRDYVRQRLFIDMLEEEK